MDYKELLTKYIQHVKDCEGVDFIPHIDRLDDYFSDVEFSKGEIKVLDQLRGNG